MREVQLREAKATLSAVIDEAQRGKPAVITRHGLVIWLGVETARILMPSGCSGFRAHHPRYPRDPCQTSIAGWNLRKYRASEAAFSSSVACSSYEARAVP